MKHTVGAVAIAVGLLLGSPSASAQQMDFVYVTNAIAGQPFWLTVKLGMDEACRMVAARCQMLWIQTRGNLDEQLSNLDAAIARKPDGIVVTLASPTLLNESVKKAVAAGIPVVAANTDHPQGSAGNARQAYVGQDLEAAGYDLAKKLSEQFPRSGPIHVVAGISAPGQTWAEQRGKGVTRFMEEYKRDNPGRDVTWRRMDTSTDMAVTASRVTAYIQATPNTTAYIDMGYWHIGVARTLRDQKMPPGKVLLGGFDLVPQAINEMKSGYIQVQVDQQPFMQGFLSIMQLYLTKKYRLSGFDVNTGRGLVTPADIGEIEALSKQGFR